MENTWGKWLLQVKTHSPAPFFMTNVYLSWGHQRQPYTDASWEHFWDTHWPCFSCLNIKADMKAHPSSVGKERFLCCLLKSASSMSNEVWCSERDPLLRREGFGFPGIKKSAWRQLDMSKRDSGDLVRWGRGHSKQTNEENEIST